MFFRCFFALFLSLVLVSSGYCFDIVYPLAGHEFMPVTKGNFYLELSSKAGKNEFDPIIIDSTIESSTIELYADYDLTDNISINMELPYISVEKKIGNNLIKNDGIGDISAGLKYQFSDQEISFGDSFLNLTASMPTGESPYKIDPSAEISTGSGGYSVKPEMTLAKNIKTALLFCSLFYQHNLTIDGLHYHQSATDGEAGVFLQEVKPGDEYGGSIGYIVFINENISWLYKFNLHREMKTSYDWQGRDDYKGMSHNFSTLSSGIAFQIPDKLAVFTTVAVGVGDEAPDYEFKLSVAF